MDNQKLKVSVIICAYTMERLKDIHEAVGSIIAQTLKPFEIILAIDHNEQLLQRLKSELPSQVKLILNQGIRGSAETRNVGIRSATGDIVAFIDDDAAAKEDWLEKLLKPYSDANVLVTGGRIISVWENGRPLWFPEELDWIVGGTYKGFTETQSHIRNVHWPNMSFRRLVCDRIGFVRTDIGAIGNTSRSGDETELCMRITHHIPGSEIVFCPEAIVYHKALPSHSNLSASIKRSFNEGKYKSINSRDFAALSDQPLSPENSYLKYLLFKAIPQRLKFFFQKGRLLQAGTIIISIIATGAGYCIGKLGSEKAGK
jgi:glucosyl-dolichyl phosphate glucuronosyltransferase